MIPRLQLSYLPHLPSRPLTSSLLRARSRSFLPAAIPPARITFTNEPKQFSQTRYHSVMHESPSSEDGNDLIFVRSLNIKATTGVDSWGRKRPQPILLTLWLKSPIALAGSTDHLPYSINYGTVAKVVTAQVENGTFNSLEHIAEEVAGTALGPDINAAWVKVVVEKPRALLRADAAGICITRKKSKDGEVHAEGGDRVFVKDLRLVTIIGVNPCEREEKQAVVINMIMHKENTPGKSVIVEGGNFNPHYNFRSVVKRVTEHVEASEYKTVEAFVTAVAKEVCIGCGILKVTVRAEKPSALTFAEGPGVEVTRERSFFLLEETATEVQQGKHEVFIALGSNLGDRFRAIKDAVLEVEKRDIRVKQTSSLYQSAPMYYLDQPTFLNGVIQAETSLSPEDLLKTLKEVESAMGRSKTIENGPRPIDLDILLYDNLTHTSETLTIPHPRMLEREFVLRPLCDISPNKPHPQTSTALKRHLASLPPTTPPLRTFSYLSANHPALDPSNPRRKTHLMAIINLTPDSFSDGGQTTPSNILPTAHAAIAAGASILDIGGCSTRPGALQVPAEVEMQRVLPAITALRSAGITQVVSIDTYRADVAAAAVAAGADMINDISAGTLDPDMLSTAARLDVPIVLMHMRGSPEGMSGLTHYPDGVVAGVLQELRGRVDAAEAAGVRRWNILLDPGLGFAKNAEQNLELLRGLNRLTGPTGLGLPWVVGPSRKGFIGRVTGVDVPAQRTWGTAAAVAAAVSGGADIVRVHDVSEMGKVVEMSTAIWRS